MGITLQRCLSYFYHVRVWHGCMQQPSRIEMDATLPSTPATTSRVPDGTHRDVNVLITHLTPTRMSQKSEVELPIHYIRFYSFLTLKLPQEASVLLLVVASFCAIMRASRRLPRANEAGCTKRQEGREEKSFAWVGQVNYDDGLDGEPLVVVAMFQRAHAYHVSTWTCTSGSLSSHTLGHLRRSSTYKTRVPGLHEAVT